MKLITYNFLTSKCLKGVKVGYPLVLKIAKKEEVEVDFNPEFIARLIPRLNWEAVCSSAELIGCANQLPADVPEDAPANEEFLQRLHHVLMEVDITEGTMECPETGRQFPIQNGIPNMLLEEFEV